LRERIYLHQAERLLLSVHLNVTRILFRVEVEADLLAIL
jgi:hypothetical protein